jgi:hypothetical protein
MVVVSVTRKMAIHVVTNVRQLPAASCQLLVLGDGYRLKSGTEGQAGLIPHSMPGQLARDHPAVGERAPALFQASFSEQMRDLF